MIKSWEYIYVPLNIFQALSILYLKFEHMFYVKIIFTVISSRDILFIPSTVSSHKSLNASINEKIISAVLTLYHLNQINKSNCTFYREKGNLCKTFTTLSLRK